MFVFEHVARVLFIFVYGLVGPFERDLRRAIARVPGSAIRWNFLSVRLRSVLDGLRLRRRQA